MTFVRTDARTHGRLLLSMIFILAGLVKLIDPAAFAALLETVGIPGMVTYGLIAVELIGGGMILVGFQAGNAAILLSVFYLGCLVLLNLGTPADRLNS